MFHLDGSQISWLIYADWLEDQGIEAAHIREMANEEITNQFHHLDRDIVLNIPGSSFEGWVGTLTLNQVGYGGNIASGVGVGNIANHGRPGTDITIFRNMAGTDGALAGSGHIYYSNSDHRIQNYDYL